MHMLVTLRSYMGLTQASLAKAVGITQPDLSEIETREPYGRIHKYLRLSRYLDIPVDALVKNDYTQIPLSFFNWYKEPDYLPVPKEPDLLLGRQGEEFILQRERARLQEIYPALAKLVLPYFKMRGPFPGYDILSFDDSGKPIFLEVKTSTHDTGGFRLTNHELDSATKLTEAGERYIICYVSGWGTDSPKVQEIPFGRISDTHRIIPGHYFCKPHSKLREKSLSGLAHFRQLRRLRQADVAEMLEITPSDLSLYENGQRAVPVNVYLRASNCLDASIDDLLKTYPAGADQEAAHE